MIPKIIHYVWVGDTPKSKLIKDCIRTWRKRLPDYRIIEWNEHNFDMHENRYIEQAYAAKRWAFVSDYIRARAIYELGGIYLDTDVRVLASLDDLLHDRAFIGFENERFISAAIFGAEKGHPWIKDIIDYYRGRDFIFNEKNQMAGVNSLSVTQILRHYGLRQDGRGQLLKDGIRVYPQGILCNPSARSKSVHLFTGSWMNGGLSLKRRLVLFIKRHISTPKGAALYQRLVRR